MSCSKCVYHDYKETEYPCNVCNVLGDYHFRISSEYSDLVDDVLEIVLKESILGQEMSQDHDESYHALCRIEEHIKAIQWKYPSYTKECCRAKFD